MRVTSDLEVQEGGARDGICMLCVKCVRTLVSGGSFRSHNASYTPHSDTAIHSFKNLNPLMPTKRTKTYLYTCTYTQDNTTLWPVTNRRDERTPRAQEKDMRVGYGWDEGMLKLSGDSQGLPQFVVIYFHRRHLMFDWLLA